MYRVPPLLPLTAATATTSQPLEPNKPIAATPPPCTLQATKGAVEDLYNLMNSEMEVLGEARYLLRIWVKNYCTSGTPIP